MDGLYQSPPYAYLPQQSTSVDNANNSYHPSSSSNMYRPFHFDDHNHHNHHNHHIHHSDTDTYHHHSSNNNGWSSSSASHPHHHNSHHNHYNYYGSNTSSNSNTAGIPSPRFKITTNLWEDEGTLCYQVDAKGICVARRQDNDMINGTKLLNVAGMSRGKRDGILKNEKGRVVVKVGAMHLKGVWIPFQRATELAEKFKILDVLYPLLVDEPSIYLCSPIGAAHNNNNNNEVILPSPPPPVTPKCNMVSSPLPFNHRNSSTSEDYPLPSNNWDSRPYSSLMNSNHHQYDSPQMLHRNSSNPDLAGSSGSPVPRSVHHHENDLYLLNNHHHTTTNNNSNSNPYDYYNNRPLNNHHQTNNRGSFSSVSSHQSYLYPSLQQHHEDDASKASSVTTPTSYVDSHSIYYGNNTTSRSSFSHEKPLYNNNHSNTSLPYIKSSPYTNTMNIPSLHNAAVATTATLLDTTATNNPNNNNNNHRNNSSSAGSTTPSSWFSPETPTAVLFQDSCTNNSKKRKASIESGGSKVVKKPAVASPGSPSLSCATISNKNKLSSVEQEEQQQQHDDTN